MPAVTPHLISSGRCGCSHFPGEEDQELAQRLMITGLQSWEDTHSGPTSLSWPCQHAACSGAERERERPAPLLYPFWGLLEAQTPTQKPPKTSFPLPRVAALGMTSLGGDRRRKAAVEAEPRASPGVEVVRRCPYKDVYSSLCQGPPCPHTTTFLPRVSLGAQAVQQRTSSPGAQV